MLNCAQTSATCAPSISSISGSTGFEAGRPSAATNRSNCAGVVTCRTRAGLGEDLELVRESTRQPRSRPGRVDRFVIATGEPDLSIDDVEQLVLDVVAVQRWTEVPRADELHHTDRAVGLLAGHLRGEEVVEEVEVLAFVTGEQRGALECHTVDRTDQRNATKSHIVGTTPPTCGSPTPQIGDGARVRRMPSVAGWASRRSPGQGID